MFVAPGEYGPLRIPAGARIVAEEGPSTTVFAGTDPAVLAVDGPDSAAVLEGLTVDGRGAAEGGVVADGSRVVVRDCVILGCWSGVRVIAGNATIANTAVRDCRNGIYLFESGGTVAGCDVSGCTQGITLVSSSPRIRRSTIRDNVTGIVVSDFSDPSVGGSVAQANRIEDNRGAAVRNAARARRTGLREAKPHTIDLSYNEWGTDCPSALLFGGPVEFKPWVDSSGNARSDCPGGK